MPVLYGPSLADGPSYVHDETLTDYNDHDYDVDIEPSIDYTICCHCGRDEAIEPHTAECEAWFAKLQTQSRLMSAEARRLFEHEV